MISSCAAQAERAEEDRRQELPLPVDADVEQVLRVVLELDPRAAVRDDLRDEQRLVFGVEERARRPVELRHDDALGAVDDERAVLGHQRDVAEIDLLLLDVADGLGAGFRILVPDDQADGHLQRHGERHAALLALVDVVLQLQRDGVAADVAHVALDDVRAAAARAEHFAIAVRVGNQHVAAAGARLPQVVQPLQLAALALPVADGVLDELERRVLAEIADRKDRLEHRLQPGVFALGRQAVHLQKTLVGLLLNLDQVRNRNRGLDLRKVDPLAVDVLRKAVHLIGSRLRASGFGPVKASRSPDAKMQRNRRTPNADDGCRSGQKSSESGVWSPVARVVLLDLDLRADFVEFLPDGFGFFLVDAFLEDLGHRFDEVLGFLQTEAGDFADDLDDVDLLVGREADERSR